MSKKKKKEQKPKVSVSVASDSIKAEKDDYRSHKFIWRMSEQYIDYSHEKYGWNNVRYHEFCDEKGIMRKLLGFEGKKWYECELLYGSTKHPSWHSIDYEDFPQKRTTVFRRKVFR